MSASAGVVTPNAARRRSALCHAAALVACVATAAVAAPLTRYLDLANIVMLFLLVVVLVAVRLGRGPAIVAAFASVALFDFFFVPPKLSFTVHDSQYLLTFAVMLLVALVTGGLTATLREQAHDASSREARTAALYRMARELAGVLTPAEVGRIVSLFVGEAIGGIGAVFIPDERGRATALEGTRAEDAAKFDASILDLVMAGGECAEIDFECYFPMIAATRVRGVLAVSCSGARAPELASQRELIRAAATLAAIALERLHYAQVAQASEIRAQTERLRSSILSALSHDIRTPLTVLNGLAECVSAERTPCARRREAAAALGEQARRLTRLVTNLLEMAKLNAGDMRLRREWQPLEEVVGASLKLLGPHLRTHPVHVDVPADLPLLEFDAVLVERVLCNLLENAAKYAPAGSAIEITARDAGAAIALSVRDHGPGIDRGDASRLFDMFVRGEKESSRPGVGLGLAIARSIVEAHGGTLTVTNEAAGGARFTMTLPKGEPPKIEGELAQGEAQ